jgi:hypothetical protein
VSVEKPSRIRITAKTDTLNFVTVTREIVISHRGVQPGSGDPQIRFGAPARAFQFLADEHIGNFDRALFTLAQDDLPRRDFFLGFFEMELRKVLSAEAARGALWLARWTTQTPAASRAPDRIDARHHGSATSRDFLLGRFDASMVDT